MTRSLPGATPLVRHQVRLCANYVPAFSAGDYTIHVEHVITADIAEVAGVTGTAGLGAGQGAVNETLTRDQGFRVTAPRFSIDAKAVFAVYPPAEGSGDYQMTLPHLTLTAASLPWERRLAEGVGKEVPWLALLLLTDNDVLADQTGSMVRTGLVGDSLDPDKVGDATLVPDLPDLVAVAGTSCRTVDVTRVAVGELLPRREELPFLAHLRHVTDDTLTVGEDRWETGRYSVLLSNRLAAGPASGVGQRFTAVLVSLEGQGNREFVGGPDTIPDPVTAVRFVVLWSWSFTSVPDPAGTFSTLVTHLAEQARPDPMLRLHEHGDAGSGRDEPTRAARERLRWGYVPVSHRVSNGDTSLAWYRGPFTPVWPPSLPDTEPPRSASGALIYLPAYGMYDVSYAAAFTLGRLLTLAKPDLAAGMSRLRADGVRALHRAATAAHRGERSARSAWESLVKNGLGPEITRKLKKLQNTEAGTPEPGHTGTPVAGTGLGRDLRDAVRALLGAGPPPAGLSVPAIALRSACQAALAEVVTRHRDTLVGAGLDPHALLEAVPFDHLVPDEAMLPQESIRFFYLDPHWLDALVAGAASIGAGTVLDQYLTGCVARRAAAEPGPPQCGVIIRSRLVAHWPDLVIDPRCGQGTDERPVLMRSRRPASDILLVLFAEVPDRVTVREPSYALHFGIDSPLSDKDRGTINLRSPKNNFLYQKDTYGVGEPLPGGRLTGVADHVRADPGVGPVLNLITGTCGVVPALATVFGLRPEEVTPAVLALELLDTRQELTFTRSTTHPRENGHD